MDCVYPCGNCRLISTFGRAPVCWAGGRGFEPKNPLAPGYRTRLSLHADQRVELSLSGAWVTSSVHIPTLVWFPLRFILAVKSIKKQHLVEVRSMGNPPPAVKLALESICLLLGEQAADWRTIRGVIIKDNFISTVVNFSTEDISYVKQLCLPFTTSPLVACGVSIRTGGRGFSSYYEHISWLLSYETKEKYNQQQFQGSH